VSIFDGHICRERTKIIPRCPTPPGTTTRLPCQTPCTPDLTEADASAMSAAGCARAKRAWSRQSKNPRRGETMKDEPVVAVEQENQGGEEAGH